MRAEVRRCTRLIAALFLLSFATLAHAGSGTPQVHDVGGVRCSVSYDGPDLIHSGYFPIHVEIFNTNDFELVVDFAAEQQWQVEDRVTKRVELQPGERYSFEPLLRARRNGMNTYAVKFTTGGERGALVVGPMEWSGGYEIPVLYCSAAAPEAGAIERWAEQWSDRSSNTYKFASHTFDQLAEEWAAYSCYEWVVLSLDEGMPPKAKLDALFAWVRTGGRLVIGGADPRAVLRDRPADAQWFTADYKVRPQGPDKYDAFHFGFGSVVLVPAPQLPDELMENTRMRRPEALVAISVYQGRTWTPGSESTGESGTDRVRDSLVGFGELPLRGLMVLLVVFALVMGPVNFWWVKRSRKPMLLLVTVPAISIVTSVGLALFGIFSQGLDIKASTRSYTFLDQPNRTATTAEVRRLFAGSSPGAGLRPEAGTMVFPAQGEDESGFRRGQIFTQDLTQGRVLGGDYIPVRKPTMQLILSDRSTRLRLDVTALGEQVEVANALGGTVERLMLRDLIGEYHQLNGTLAAGSTQRLVANVDLAQRKTWDMVHGNYWAGDLERQHFLPRGAFIAEVRADGLRDDCGVEVNELQGSHFVFGVYAHPGGNQR